MAVNPDFRDLFAALNDANTLEKTHPDEDSNVEFLPPVKREG